MEKKNLENIISKEKLFCNLKKYWWIILVCIVLALGVRVASAAIETNSSNEFENTENEMEEETEDICGKNIIVDIVWDAEIKSDVEYTLRRDDLEEIRGVITSYDFIVEINEQLKKSEYEKLKTSDIIVIEIVSSDRLSFYITSHGDGERATYILDKTMELVMKNAIENYSVDSYEVVTESDVVSPTILNGRYYFYPAVEDEKEDIVEDENSVQQRSGLIEGVVLIVLAAFIGALIILLLITLDKKIYSENEVEKLLDIECLGCCSNKKGQANKLINIVLGKAKVKSIKELRIVSNKAIDNVEFKQFEKKMNSAGVDTKTVVDVMNNDNFCAVVDKTIILAIQANVDTIDDVWNAYYCLKKAGGCIEGFILI